MARNDNLSDLLTDIASAIKTKKGYEDSTKINAQNFPEEINGINTGITPSGNIELQQQSGTDVSNYATASVKTGTAGAVSGGALTHGDTTISGDYFLESGTNDYAVTASNTASVSAASYSITTAGWISSAGSGTTASGDDVKSVTKYLKAGEQGTPTSGFATSTTALTSPTEVETQYFSVKPSVLNTTGWIEGERKTGDTVAYKVKDGTQGTPTSGFATLTSSSSDVLTATSITSLTSQYFKIRPSVTNTTGWITGTTKNADSVVYKVKSGSADIGTGTITPSFSRSGNVVTVTGSTAMKASVTEGWISSIAESSAEIASTGNTYTIPSGSATTPTNSTALTSSSTSLSEMKLTVQASVTPTISEGWVTSGTAGTVKISGTVPTETQSVNLKTTSQTINPSSGKLLSSVTVPAIPRTLVSSSSWPTGSTSNITTYGSEKAFNILCKNFYCLYYNGTSSGAPSSSSECYSIPIDNLFSTVSSGNSSSIYFTLICGDIYIALSTSLSTNKEIYGTTDCIKITKSYAGYSSTYGPYYKYELYYGTYTQGTNDSAWSRLSSYIQDVSASKTIPTLLIKGYSGSNAYSRAVIAQYES